MPFSLVVSVLYEFSLAGVNRSIPGNGGQECAEYLPTWQKILESAVFVPLCIYGIFSSFGYLELPDQETIKNGSTINKKQLSDSLPVDKFVMSGVALPLRHRVFNIYACVFSIEFIYKMITRNGIFFLNPCHICTILQLILLKMPIDDPKTTQLFRFHMYTMPGAVLALAFPILNTRLLAGEVFIYFVQHLFIVITPIYLMALEHAYIPESTSNVAWPIFGMSTIVLYHFTVLQPLSLLTHVNLNVILCPSLNDPFAGRFYRICAISHQCLMVPLVTKLYGFSTQYTAMVIQLLCTQPKRKQN